jgi:hypothetical protein
LHCSPVKKMNRKISILDASTVPTVRNRNANVFFMNSPSFRELFYKSIQTFDSSLKNDAWVTNPWFSSFNQTNTNDPDSEAKL